MKDSSSDSGFGEATGLVHISQSVQINSSTNVIDEIQEMLLLKMNGPHSNQTKQQEDCPEHHLEPESEHCMILD